MKTSLITLLATCMMGLTVLAQERNGFTIRGRLKGLLDGTWLYLVHNSNSGGIDTLSRIKANHQRFTFKGKVPLEGEAYFIKLDTAQTKYNKKINGYVVILMENKNIRVKGVVHDLKTTKINGSLTHDEFINFKKATTPLIERTNKLYNELYNLKGSPDPDSVYLNSLEAKANAAKSVFPEYRKHWIEKHPDSYLTPWLIPQAFRMNKDTAWIVSSYNRLTERSKSSKYGVELKTYIATLQNTSIGSIAPELTLPTPSGERQSLKGIASKGELTLVDFWASWCKPCREAFPSMKKVYEQYHPRGLNILGVSIDLKIENWKTAIIEDDLPWFNVHDEGKDATNLYGISAIPISFLLDREMRIISKWSGENKKLDQIINIYLKK